MYEIFQKLCDERGIKPATVAKETGIATSTLTDWKHGRYVPKPKKLQQIADFFGVSVEYIMTGVQPEGYYLNDETAKIAQAIYDRPELRALFDAAEDVSPNDVKLAAEMLLRFKETNKDG